MMLTGIELAKIRKGDKVWFKADVEQVGRVVEIKLDEFGQRVGFKVEPVDGEFYGHYLHGSEFAHLKCYDIIEVA